MNNAVPSLNPNTNGIVLHTRPGMLNWVKGGFNLGDTVTAGFMVGVNLIIACIIVSLGLFLMNSGKNLASTFSNKIASMNSSIADENIMMYDGTTVKGSDVVNCIKKHLNDLDITVVKKCGASVDTAYDVACNITQVANGHFVNLPSYATLDMSNNYIPDTHQVYVNPNADFRGTVLKNANGAITGIRFEQTAYRNDVTEVPNTGNTTIVISNQSDTDSITTAIAELNNASIGLKEAIAGLSTNLGTSSEGSSSINEVQQQTLAAISALTDAVAEIRDEVTSLSGVSGIDPSLSKNVNDLMEKMNTMYDEFINSAAAMDKPNHSNDDIYSDLTSANQMLNQIDAMTKTLNAQLVQVQASIDSLSSTVSTMQSQMSSEHQQILQILEAIQKTEERQNDKLDALTASVDDAMSELALSKITIAQQKQTISNLEQELASLRASAGTTSLETYGDLQRYNTDRTKQLQTITEVNSAVSQMQSSTQSISASYKALSDWLKTQPKVKA